MCRPLVICVATALAGCLHVPEPSYTGTPPPLVDGQPLVAEKHGFTTKRVDDCASFTVYSSAWNRCVEEAQRRPERHHSYWTVSYGDRKLTHAELIMLGDEYAGARSDYERSSRRCSRARIPRYGAAVFALAAGGAYFLGPDNGLDGDTRYIVTGAALGAAALMYGIGYLVGGSACDDADGSAARIDAMLEGNQETRISHDIQDAVDAFNAKHHIKLAPPPDPSEPDPSP